ncbi:AfsR/SARP family transcriptional regulator [Clostridium sp. UBA6640]|uniref:AfsR/SARP family transcriptional regulator n=1 Tax=Clostridium sp. UBA6640 TaxID=1946370 RepID=UPI0025C40FE6|nr:BTAD domain-containing putative transcriptional regulator [Clostridium sp. UBA6640]
MKKLEIYLLGNIEIRLDSQSILEKLSSKAIALLCFLCANKGKKFGRDKLATYFWNGVNIESARYNLRYNFWNIRKIINENKFSEDIIISTKDSCMINPNYDFYIDIFHLDNILNSIEKNHNTKVNLNDAKKLFRGEFLEEFYIKNCPEFNDWIFYERAKLQRTYEDILCKLIDIHYEDKEYDNAINLLEEMLNINPFKEELYLKLMKIYIDLGDRSSAIKQYERCENILREELNVRPMEDIRNLYEGLINGSLKPSHKERYIENTSVKLTLLKIDKNDIKPLQMNLSKASSKNIMCTKCYPIKSINYCWISNVIDCIISIYDIGQLRRFEKYYWVDLLRVHPKVQYIDDTLIVRDILTPQTEKNRIFIALENLLNYISAITVITIIIENLHMMDNISFDFLQYYIIRNENINIKFIVSSDENDSKFDKLKYT